MSFSVLLSLCLCLTPLSLSLTHTHTLTHIHTRARARTHARTHTRTHARTHAHTHTHTHSSVLPRHFCSANGCPRLCHFRQDHHEGVDLHIFFFCHVSIKWSYIDNNKNWHQIFPFNRPPSNWGTATGIRKREKCVRLQLSTFKGSVLVTFVNFCQNYFSATF